MKKIGTEKDIKILFTRLNVRYIMRNEYIFPDLKKVDLRVSNYYLDNYNEFTFLEEKYGEKLRKNYKASVYIQKVNEQIGYGLFTYKYLKANTLIGEYSGIVQEAQNINTTDKEISDKTEYAWDYPDDIPNLPSLEINARYAGGVLRFVNHSFQPNLRIEHTVVGNEWKIFFVADENIEANSELFVDYGDAYWAVESREIII